MESQPYTPILKRVGIVLAAVGLIDIGIMIYCIVRGLRYASSFNIFAVIAGVFLLLGSLRAASIVRMFAIFLFAVFFLTPLFLVFLLPWNFVTTMLRVCPSEIVSGAAQWMFLVLLLFWVIQELGREPIQAAIVEAGGKRRGIVWPAVAGAGLIVVIGVGATIALHSETAKDAVILAQQKTGPGYRIFVHALSYRKDERGEFFSAAVYAWNEKGIWDFPVHWER